MPPRSARPTPALSSAARRTGTTLTTCAREASSGTTPPYGAWTSCCDATTSDSTRRPSSTTAAAVSSHELSRPRISTGPLERKGERRASWSRTLLGHRREAPSHPVGGVAGGLEEQVRLVGVAGVMEALERLEGAALELPGRRISAGQLEGRVDRG